MGGLIQGTVVARICGQRDAAMSMMERAAALLEEGHALAREAAKMAASAADGARFTPVDRSSHDSYARLFKHFDHEGSITTFREHTDACVWVHLLGATGLEHMMDATAREAFMAQLADAPVEVTEANVYESLRGLAADSGLIFQRGLARAFAGLDKRFKSHDAFKLGARIIITNAFDGYGTWSYYRHHRAIIHDVERVLAILDGATPEPGELDQAIADSRPGYGARQSVCETRYLKIRIFKNGNAHLWFTRPDLVEKANQVLADYYGEVLPDGVPATDVELRSESGLPSRDLAFYRSPVKVVHDLLLGGHLGEGCRVLEPSAGDGAIVRGVLLKEPTARVDAVEIDPGRIAALSSSGARVLPGNFLRMPVREVYDAVFMNPPFCGTHWMEHVLHAWAFLRPGGALRAILPATAEVGQSAKHQAFRRWAGEHGGGCRSEADFTPLPAESFAESGTRIQTVILTMRKAY